MEIFSSSNAVLSIIFFTL